MDGNLIYDRLYYLIEEIRVRPPEIRLLSFVGRAGVATHTQAFNALKLDPDFSGRNDDQAITDIIVKALKNGDLQEVKPNFHAPRQIILYPTVAGYNKVLAYDPKLAAQLIYGEPDERRVKNIRHDLIIGESVILWNETCRIISYKNESKLRGENLCLRHRLKRAKFVSMVKAEDDDSLADYQIGLIYRSSRQETEFKCEAVVKYSRPKIAGKSEWMRWYADTDYQAGKILALIDNTKSRVTILQPLKDLPDPEFDRTVRRFLDPHPTAGREMVNHVEQLILDVLNRTQLTMCIHDLKMFIRADRQALERGRDKLIKSGTVKYQTGRIAQGKGAGRPNVYIFLPENEQFLEGLGFTQHLTLNAVQRMAINNKLRPVNFDPTCPALTIVDGKNKTTFISDFTENEHPDSVCLTAARFRDLSQSHPHPVRLAVIDSHRYEKLRELLGQENLFKLCDFHCQ